MARRAAVAALAVALLATTGCYSATEAVRVRHAGDFGCDPTRVGVTDRTGADAYFLASGCGVDATYAVLTWSCGRGCQHHLCVREREWPTGTVPTIPDAR